MMTLVQVKSRMIWKILWLMIETIGSCVDLVNRIRMRLERQRRRARLVAHRSLRLKPLVGRRRRCRGQIYIFTATSRWFMIGEVTRRHRAGRRHGIVRIHRRISSITRYKVAETIARCLAKIIKVIRRRWMRVMMRSIGKYEIATRTAGLCRCSNHTLTTRVELPKERWGGHWSQTVVMAEM